MKLVALTAAAVASASTAFAGSVAYVAPAAPMIEEPATMGGSGMWLIPLIAIALIALAMSADNTVIDE